MNAREIIDRFGGQTALATLLGKPQSTVSYWVKTGIIPVQWQARILDIAAGVGVTLTTADFIGATKAKASGGDHSKSNDLVAKMPSKSSALSLMAQGTLNLGIDKQIEIDGVGMGVLSDGTPFLTGRGLARLVGLASSASAMTDLGTEWAAPDEFPRSARIREIIEARGGHVNEKPYIEIKQRSGYFHAWPDYVCLAVLEYYAFDAGSNIKPDAIKNFRLLAGKALREFIYTQVGYDPQNAVPPEWRQFHDRVSLAYNAVPRGYFSIFKEMADVVVTLGQSGLFIDHKFVPDISVGSLWARHWKESGLAARFGERMTYEHNYPSYFPQSISNPQDACCYPEEALGEFRRWLRESYIGGGKFKTYIESKVKDRSLPPAFAQLAISAYGRE